MNKNHVFNLEKLGNTLYILFLNKYSNIFNNNNNNTVKYDLQEYSKKIKLAITDVLSEIRLPFPTKIINTTELRIGDIVIFNHHSSFQNYFMLLGQDIETANYITFPNLGNKELLTKTQNSFNVYRPNYNLIDKTIIEDLGKGLMSESTYNAIIKGTQTFHEDFSNLDDSALQIGDIVFLVDPSNITLTAQNGYQYFPTIRTQGDPKLPSLSYIKNIHINLIFPNEDSINFQLLPLFAMFKRTPFVNLRNKDICDFLSGLKFIKEDYISVALESINIQSIEGFPNSLQASISLLPFDPRTVSNGLFAIRSMGDAIKQQTLNTKDRFLEKSMYKLDSKLHEYSPYSDKTSNILGHTIEYTPDFRASLPFRCYYQGIFDKNDRKYVLNSDGSPAMMYDLLNNNPLNQFAELEPFNTKLTKPLRHYKNFDNRQPFSLTYNYITEDVRNFAKKLSAIRLKEQTDLSQRIKKVADTLEASDPYKYMGMMINSINNTKTFLEKEKYKFNEQNNALVTLLRDSGLEVKSFDMNKNMGNIDHDPGNFLLSFFHYGWHLFANNMNQINVIFKTVEGVEGVIKDDLFNLTPMVTQISTGDTFFPNNGSNYSFIEAVEKIQQWAEKNEKNKASFKKLLEMIRERSINELTQSTIIQDSSSLGSTIDGNRVVRLPIDEDSILFDNSSDVIIGWGISFVNKFVPIHLQGYTYPMYQHIGSEDCSINLSVFSTSHKKAVDLKTKIGLMSDRIYESSKIIHYTAPEIQAFSDFNLKVDINEKYPNHFFRCFGIHDVVFDACNISNVEGSPGSWKLSINLTQNNMTLKKYHQIEDERSNSAKLSNNNIDDIQMDIATLFPKLEYNIEEKMFEYYDYYQKVPTSQPRSQEVSITFGNEPSEQSIDSVLVNDLNQLMTTSFLFNYGQTIIDKYDTIVTTKKKNNKIYGTETGNTINVVYNDLKKNIYRVKNKEKTQALNNITSQNESFNSALHLSLHAYNTTNKSAFDQLSNSIFQADPRGIGAFKDDLFVAGIAGLLAFGLIAGLATSTVLLVATVRMAARLPDFIDNQIKIQQNKINPFITTMINNYRQGVVLDIAKRINKDPAMLYKLSETNLFGSDLVIKNLNNKRATKKSCYKDFDAPVIFIDQESNFSDIITLSPDFYLFTWRVTEAEIHDFVSESMKNISRIRDFASMFSFIDIKTAKQKFNDLKESLSTTLDNATLNKYEKLLIDKNIEQMGGLEKIQKIYYDSVFSEMGDPIKNGEDFLNSLDVDAHHFKDEATFQSFKDLFTSVIKIRTAPVTDINERRKIIALSIRLVIFVEFMEIYGAIIHYLSSNNIDSASQFAKTVGLKTFSINQFVKNTHSKDDQSKYAIDGMQRIYDVVHAILDNSLNAAQGSDNNEEEIYAKDYAKNKKLDHVRKILDNGYPNINISGENDQSNGSLLSAYGSLPNLKILETKVYDLVSKLNRINSYIRHAKMTLKWESIGSFLPEYSAFDLWNFKEAEDLSRRLELLRSLSEDIYKQKGCAKLFPTFKIFFVEENKSLISEFNNYFSYDAVQSIEIVKNKHSASQTAVLRLSNALGHLTNRFNLNTEASDFLRSIDAANYDYKFLGSIDIKPGTPIIIKLGYSADENELDTVFYGKIVEMNPGPNVEIIAQSNGAQLHHHITRLKFGFTSTVNAHGDIATAIIDNIPKLQKFGEKQLLPSGLDSATRKTPKHNGSYFERHILSNLFGKFSSSFFMRDNPRDANIYLPYDVLYRTLFFKPTFDWIVYDQSVWDSLRELSTFNRNTIVTTRLYNVDRFSSKDDLRETLVIGNKAGYYKYTDSYFFGNLNYKNVNEKINDFKYIINLINTSNIDTYFLKEIGFSPTRGEIDFKIDNSDLLEVIKFLSTKAGTIMMSTHIKKNWDEKAKIVPISTILRPIILPLQLRILNGLEELREYNPVNININIGDIITTKHPLHTYLSKISIKTIGNIKQALNAKVINTNVITEDHYNVSNLTTNTDSSLVENHQYKKIQKHHFISDKRDIISNDISLNSTFSNSVNIYYLDEPKFVNSGSLSHKQVKSLSVFPIKAFGDINDYDLRTLDSFQKNVDTNWWDIYMSGQELLSSISNMHDTNFKKVKLKNTEDINKYNNTLKADFKNDYWKKFPSFLTVGVNLLKQEVEKMYRGTITIVGKGDIEPFDILHLEDIMSDMSGCVEIEEVIHRFTPHEGFTTVITPSLITYDRDPIQMQDIAIINDINKKMNQKTAWSAGFGLAGAGVSAIGITGAAAWISGLITAGTISATGVGALALIGFGTASMVGVIRQRTKFIYDQMANILGRDCINFTTLIYHGYPYVAGFEGVDYTNLKTLINHRLANIDGPLTALAAYSDPIQATLFGDKQSALGMVLGFSNLNDKGNLNMGLF